MVPPCMLAESSLCMWSDRERESSQMVPLCTWPERAVKWYHWVCGQWKQSNYSWEKYSLHRLYQWEDGVLRFLVAVSLTHCSLGAAWWPNPNSFRPLFVAFNNVVNTIITNVTFLDAPNHNLELYASYCEVNTCFISCIWLLCRYRWYAIIILLLYHYRWYALLLLCHYYTIIDGMPCHYYAIIDGMPCQYYAIIIPL